MIEYLRLIIDSCLFVLIVIVQIIVYPSFIYYERENLLKWHKIYTKKIALIVLPLMLSQLTISLIQVYLVATITSITYVLLVLFLWIVTLLKFAPMHTEISKGNFNRKFLNKLIYLNWMRTTAWFILLILSAEKFIF
ncbi:MAG: hypothetical protein CMP63_00870 [Flavobacteriales bacterium]|nr:hypothetical protein [Flavobacteriales bacterium]|tara:strand:- start:1362 stop:1772 length:411 start_codon:yes stop_codon:yes gene_type:complete